MSGGEGKKKTMVKEEREKQEKKVRLTFAQNEHQSEEAGLLEWISLSPRNKQTINNTYPQS